MLTEEAVRSALAVVAYPGKAVEMFRKLDVPVVGVVENMSFAACACGRRSYPFGRGGGEALASLAGCALLGQVPFEETTVEGGDAGSPAVTGRPDGATAAAFMDIARRVCERLALAPASSVMVQAS